MRWLRRVRPTPGFEKGSFCCLPLTLPIPLAWAIGPAFSFTSSLTDAVELRQVFGCRFLDFDDLVGNGVGLDWRLDQLEVADLRSLAPVYEASFWQQARGHFNDV